MARILIIRFSALGDVAMTIPVIASFVTQYPENEIIILTRKNFSSLFLSIRGNIQIIGADLESEHAGFSGLLTLFSQLRKLKPELIIDLHSVLRSRILRFLFSISGIKTKRIHKGRIKKHRLTRKKNKQKIQLPSTFDRYKNVFEKSGYPLNSAIIPVLEQKITREFSENGQIQIGIAPFAKHESKMYPLHLMEEVIKILNCENRYRIVLFGGGKEESEILNRLQEKYQNTISIAGKYCLADEMNLMSQLKLMVSMDSANMHLAALAGTTVISIWGSTHSFAGFGAWNQPSDNKIEIDLPCRPCSVYGNKPCYRGDLACMNGITPEMIVSKINAFL